MIKLHANGHCIHCVFNKIPCLFTVTAGPAGTIMSPYLNFDPSYVTPVSTFSSYYILT